MKWGLHTSAPLSFLTHPLARSQRHSAELEEIFAIVLRRPSTLSPLRPSSNIFTALSTKPSAKYLPGIDPTLNSGMEGGLEGLVSLVASAAMVFGGVFPYIPQWIEIRRTETCEGFSLYVCFALLVANTLRILFWFGRAFEIPLLLQSILMNGTMLAMIWLCVTTRAKTDLLKKKERRLSAGGGWDPPRVRRLIDLRAVDFWDWTDFPSYVQCVGVIAFVGALMMYTFQEYSVFVETVGFAAVFVEAMLGVPQFLKNRRKGSTRGMNLTMVLMWMAGDTFKTVYFIMRDAPFQFSLCGCLQIGVDLAILSQVYFYGDDHPTRVG